MIIWINGAFGAGKSQTAYELHRRIQNSFVYDPENVGLFIDKNIPKEIKKDDFQDYEAWREMNFSIIREIARSYNGVLIIPMTIISEEYFKEIIGLLIMQGIDVKHFTLMVSKEALLKRLNSRGDNPNSWPAKQIDRCLTSLSLDVFKEHIYTDDISIEAVTEKIAELSNIDILPNSNSYIKKKFIRVLIQLKQLRIFKNV